MLDAATVALMNAVLQACITAGRVTVPPHLVGPSANLLGRMMFDYVLRHDYYGALERASAAADRIIPGTEKMLLNSDSGIIPETDIVGRGFDWLSPEQIADYMVSRAAADALAWFVLEGRGEQQHGPWVEVAITEIYAPLEANPELARRRFRRFRKLLRRLEDKRWWEV